MGSNGYPAYGRQYQGLTRNKSPVYLMYPPDESGRRPNELASLQYANPSQQEASQRLVAAQQTQCAGVHQPDDGRHYAGTPQDNYGPPRQTATDPLRVSQRAGPTTITGGVSYTSSRGSNDSYPGTHAQTPSTTYWYCSNPGCTYRGPYIESLYDNCCHGCGARRSPGRHQEYHSLRERAPTDIPSSSSRTVRPQSLQRSRGRDRR